MPDEKSFRGKGKRNEHRNGKRSHHQHKGGFRCRLGRLGTGSKMQVTVVSAAELARLTSLHLGKPCVQYV